MNRIALKVLPALVEEAAAAAESMQEQARELAQIVSQFQLDDAGRAAGTGGARGEVGGARSAGRVAASSRVALPA